MSTGTSVLREVLDKIIGTDRTEHLFKLLVIHPEIAAAPGPQVSRAVLAQALNMLLFEDLLRRVPTAKTYADYTLGKGRQTWTFVPSSVWAMTIWPAAHDWAPIS